MLEAEAAAHKKVRRTTVQLGTVSSVVFAALRRGGGVSAASHPRRGARVNCRLQLVGPVELTTFLLTGCPGLLGQRPCTGGPSAGATSP